MQAIVKFLILILLVSSNWKIKAQNQAQNWYFGNYAGLSFSTTPPTVLTNGSLTTAEGCATISDNTGNLLFYSDGATVWNKLHQIMANGTGLLGNTSTTQSDIIVKQPGNTNIYYIFTLDAIGGSNGLRYSVIDMALAAGMGSVTTKNVLLYTPSAEKLTAVRHCNGVDCWVLSHEYGTSTFRAYLLTSAGVSASPVLSTIGSTITGSSSTAGQLKISPNGRKLAQAIYSPGAIELYDFDPALGTVSNSLVVSTTTTEAYGCEFSPDGTRFYGATYNFLGELYQWDLCAGSASAILASQSIISTSLAFVGALQSAPNGKIYLARSNQYSLGVINNPNALGTACNFVVNGQTIQPKTSFLGLPNFVNSYFKPAPLPFTYTTTCQTASFTAGYNPTLSTCGASVFSITGQQWDFGDPLSGSSNTATALNPVHVFSANGTYTVKYIVFSQCSADTVSMPVVITTTSATPNLSVTGTFTICKGETVHLTASGATSYSWNTSANTASVSLSPTISTAYTVVGSNGACSALKTITITVQKCLGVEEGDYELSLRIYPNPVSDELTIENETQIQFSLYNQTGQLIIKKQLEAGTHSFDTGSLSAGIYTMKVFGKNGFKTAKLVKIE